jgi:hypothetical protein
METKALRIEVDANEAEKASLIIKKSDLENRFICLVSRITKTLWSISVDFTDNTENERERVWDAVEFQLTTGGVENFKIS